MRTVVISAYPCCGKTFCFERLSKRYIMLETKSSDFKYIKSLPTQEEVDDYTKKLKEEGTIRLMGDQYFIDKFANTERITPNPKFPNNYINFIRENFDKVDIIFIDNDLDVRKALQDAEIEYVTVYPDPDLIEEWVGRMYLRKDPDFIIERRIDKWDKDVKGVDSEPHGKYVHRLWPRQYLADVLDAIVACCHDTENGIKDVIVPDPRKE